jgi:transcriptional regulator with XRE-family HTH domain
MQVERIHKGKTPRRIHYIAEWAARRQLKQADVVRELGADKGTVSRWFAGALPEQPYLFRLAALFGMEEPNELFHHPDDNWMSRFLQGKSMDEIRRLRQMIEAAFPPKTGTDG